MMPATTLVPNFIRAFVRPLLVAGAVALTAPCANAGDFNLNWSAIDWPAGAKGPFLFPLYDPNGFRIDTVIGTSGVFAPAPITLSPDDLALFGGTKEALVLISDAGFQAGSIGESTVSSSIAFYSGGAPFAVDGLSYNVSDIDASDNDLGDDRCDFVTVTGDAGIPQLSALSATPTFLIGPGPGAGLTGFISANQAQCAFIDGPIVSSTSNNDITGTLRVVHPDSTSRAEIFYDESIGNVRGFRVDEDPYARGTSTWEDLSFSAPQAISLLASPSVTEAQTGDVVTYTYTITNEGDLPFNTGQSIVIRDSRLGDLTCPAITADVAPGDSFVCTGNTTVTSTDEGAGSIDSVATAGIGLSGQIFEDRLQSNTELLSVGISAPPPDFPTGSGLSSSVCNASSPTGNAFADIGIRWDNNGSSAASIDRFDLFASGSNQTVSGLTASINLNDLNIDRQTVPASSSIGSYIAYNFTTQAFAGVAEIYGIGIAGYSATQPWHNQASGRYKFAILIDDDPAFGTPQVLMSDTQIDDGSMPGAVSVFTSDFGSSIYNFGHYDASGEVIQIEPSTTYYVRVFPFDDTVSGKDDQQPYSQIVLWDDFMLKTVSCTPTQIEALDDDFTATPLNSVFGGLAGNALTNDTLGGVALDAALVETSVTIPATPLSAGDPVPFLETSGAAEGVVSIPAGTPPGIYTISYEICEALSPANCSQATITVAVIDPPEDRGDAPASYGEARHIIIPEIYLGTTPPDADGSSLASAAADGDDLSGISDEDGILTFPDLVAGTTVPMTIGVHETLNLIALPPAFGITYLQMWIDFDGNGIFDVTEQVATDVLNGGPQDLDGTFNASITVNVTVPATVSGGNSFARVRWSTTNGVAVDPALGLYTDGEVEDFQVTLLVTPPEADLTIDKQALSAADGTPVTALEDGDAVDFVITLTNDGPGTPSDVVVKELLQSGYTYVSDDAAASGTGYDPDTGHWTVGSLASGASVSLTVRATMRESGNYTNTAEVISSSLPDPDSDAGTGTATDDLGDGIADDDEATVELTLTPSGQTLSGRVFIDNGSGVAVAHDGVQSGAEIGTAQARVALLDDTGSVLANIIPDAAGSWSVALPAGYSGSVTVRVTATGDLRPVSETGHVLPGIVNADPYDGIFTFTPAAGTDYPDLDVGLIKEATLTQSQEATLAAGQVVALRHEYLAHSSGSVTFAIADVMQTPSGAFAAALFSDADCDGTPESAINDPLPVSADTRMCLVVRVNANAGVGDNAVYTFDLSAETSYSAITFVETDLNTDRITISSEDAGLVLSKTVQNETQGTGEGTSNNGAVGDVLEYRIYVTNPGADVMNDLVIFDQTPAYTELAEAAPSTVLLGAGLSCTLAVPATNTAGYVGALRWDCAGPFVPGEQGSVSFRVRISP